MAAAILTIADPAIGGSYDIGSIIKARNYQELETIRQKMALFDSQREIASGSPQSAPAVISLRDHFLTPNPQDTNLEFSPILVDDGLRWDPETNTTVTKIERFRHLLSDRVEGGNLIIEFDTTRMRNFGSFFRGPDFSNPSNIQVRRLP